MKLSTWLRNLWHLVVPSNRCAACALRLPTVKLRPDGAERCHLCESDLNSLTPRRALLWTAADRVIWQALVEYRRVFGLDAVPRLHVSPEVWNAIEDANARFDAQSKVVLTGEKQYAGCPVTVSHLIGRPGMWCDAMPDLHGPGHAVYEPVHGFDRIGFTVAPAAPRIDPRAMDSWPSEELEKLSPWWREHSDEVSAAPPDDMRDANLQPCEWLPDAEAETLAEFNGITLESKSEEGKD